MSTQRWITFSVMMIVAASLLAAALTPSIRAKIQNHFLPVGREILATAEGNVLNDGSPVKVIKYRDRDGIFVEVVKVDLATDGTTLVDRIQLPDKHDGLFNFQGRVTRLAIADIDQDGKMEILAPTFDNQLVPHLNVFRYNSAAGRFEPFQPTPTK